MCVCVCVGACVRACVHACVRVCVCVCERELGYYHIKGLCFNHQANWVPRRQKDCPKMIDQIHWEAKQEEAEKMRGLPTCSCHHRYACITYTV